MYNKVRQNLIDITESIDKIFKYIENINDPDEFFNNELVFDAVLMNFVIIGEAVTRIDEDFKNQNDTIDWKNIKGLRNIVAHDYFGVDAEEIWQIIQNNLPVFKRSILKILTRNDSTN